MAQILRLPEILRLTGLSRSTIYDMMRRGKFPASIQLGERAIGWLASDIDAWIEARARRARGIVESESEAARPAA